MMAGTLVCGFSLWPGIPDTWWLGPKCESIPGERKRERAGRGCIIFNGLVTDAMWHHFCCLPRAGAATESFPRLKGRGIELTS